MRSPSMLEVDVFAPGEGRKAQNTDVLGTPASALADPWSNVFNSKLGSQLLCL